MSSATRQAIVAVKCMVALDGSVGGADLFFPMSARCVCGLSFVAHSTYRSVSGCEQQNWGPREPAHMAFSFLAVLWNSYCSAYYLCFHCERAVAFQTLEHIKAMPFSSWRKLTPGQKKVWTAISGVVVGGSVMKVSRLAGHVRSDPKNPGQRLSVSLSLKKSHTRNFTHNRSPTLIFHGA